MPSSTQVYWPGTEIRRVHSDGTREEIGRSLSKLGLPRQADENVPRSQRLSGGKDETSRARSPAERHGAAWEGLGEPVYLRFTVLVPARWGCWIVHSHGRNSPAERAYLLR